MSVTRPAQQNSAPSFVHLRDGHQPIQTMVRELSRKRFANITSKRELSIEEQEHPDDFIYGSHLTVIQIAAKDMRLTFKSHFNLSDVKSLTQRGSKVARTQNQIRTSTYDLFKEYSNLVAGGICQQLQSCGVVAGISLPIATSGFDEIIASDELRSSRFCDYWRIRGEDFYFSCSVYAEIFERELLDMFVYEDINLKGDSGDIELL